jgi:hypothetical protein
MCSLHINIYVTMKTIRLGDRQTSRGGSTETVTESSLAGSYRDLLLRPCLRRHVEQILPNASGPSLVG